MKNDFAKVQTNKEIMYLPNGIENSIANDMFESYMSHKFESTDKLELLYLAHMMKDKGYDKVLELAKQTKGQNIHFHFAGSWQSRADEAFFNDFITEHELQTNVTYHGFISGEDKRALFMRAHLLIYPSKNDAFPLTLLESLSCGVPVIATDEGSIPYILDEKSGIILDDVEKLPEAFEAAKEKLLNRETAIYCRERYLNNFSLEQFENNLINILKEIR